MVARRPSPLVPMDSLFGYTLRRLSVSLMGSLARRLAELDLRIAEASVLILVAENKGVTQVEAGRALGIQRANMAPLTAGLMARSLMLREVVDGRSQGLELTPKGKRLAGAALAVMRSHDNEFTRDLSVEEQEQLIALLRRLGALETASV